MDSTRRRLPGRRKAAGVRIGAAGIALALWFAAAMTLPTPLRAQPQRLELAGHLGYQWGGLADETTKDEGVNTLDSALGIHGSAVFGLIFNYHFTRTLHLELVWDQQPTQIDVIDRAADSTVKLTDMRVHYYHAGLVYNWSKSTKQPFVGMTVGLTRYQAREGESLSGFSIAPVFGYKTWMSNRFGLRIHTRALLTNLKAGQLFTNPDTGYSYTHNINTFAIQIQVGLALMFGM